MPDVRGSGMTSTPIEVVAATIVDHGRVLAARRTGPADVAGGWEFPGGKSDSGESAEAALIREVREELGCGIEVVHKLAGRVAIKAGYVLTAYLARILDGSAVPHEHDAIRWLGPEELEDVDWLPADVPFLPELRALLLAGEQLPGGNVGGASRIGTTVRRPAGPWSPAVHALLDHLASRGLRAVPRVLGLDELGREVLTFIPGEVLDVDFQLASADALSDVSRWLSEYHHAVADFAHPGPWRGSAWHQATSSTVCHNDVGCYNVVLSSSATGQRVAGVIDWDVAGPGAPLDDLAAAAWTWLPLYRAIDDHVVAERLQIMTAAYGQGVTAEQLLAAVPERVQATVHGIRAGQAAGDEGMLNLRRVGEPDRTAAQLATFRKRLPVLLDCADRLALTP
ncbi:MAG: NUDIX domain-containing protein [Nocardioidaceae bacterium]